MKRLTDREKKRIAAKKLRRAGHQQKRFAEGLRVEDARRDREALLKRHARRAARKSK